MNQNRLSFKETVEQCGFPGGHQKTTRPTTFTHTRAAFVIYDEGHAARQVLWDAAESDSDVAVAQAADAAALEKLQDAFYLDTQEVNSREHCKHIDAYDMRKLVTKHNPQPLN
jgi:hypothetical protein